MKSLSKLAGLACAGFLLLAADAPQQPERPNGSPRDELSEVFPRTRALLAWLEQHDPETHAKLEEHGRRLADEAEGEALAFVEQHHPELARVLADLRKGGQKARRAHRTAMRELVRDAVHLAELAKRAPNVHAAALESWRSRSRVRLLSARLALPRPQASPAELAELVARAQAAERRLLALRLERLKAQAERVERRLQEDPQQAVARELESLGKDIQRRRNGK